ncbi:MAG: hypothetical protein A2297_01945 [Elusimicrobia bacterium RIFOXYB2_FULL_48_7]|nr:MAG: hypothetical protein A2297_01945 [Elusimicrobia bacterium RIFOXYB2_FULL_48_7]
MKNKRYVSKTNVYESAIKAGSWIGAFFGSMINASKDVADFGYKVAKKSVKAASKSYKETIR